MTNRPRGLHAVAHAPYNADCLLTWSLTHLANAHLRPKIGDLYRIGGYEPPTICTPDELTGGTP